MKMGAGGGTGRTYVTNDLPLLNVAAHPHATPELAHVSILGLIALAVLYDNNVAITAIAAGEGYLAVACSFDRGTRRCSIVGSTVCADGVQNRMLTVGIEA